MASSRKKLAVDETAAADGNEVDEDMSDEDTDESENEFMNQEVQVEFEACMPQDSDFDGIKTLLQQLFLKANISLSDLADIIISQNYVGSVIKQVDAEDDDDEFMDDDSGDTVFGLVTIINLTDKKILNEYVADGNSVTANTPSHDAFFEYFKHLGNTADEEICSSSPGTVECGQIDNVILNKDITVEEEKDCIKQIISMVTSQSKSVSPQDGLKMEELLNNPNEKVGLLINERFINIPHQITLPALQSLRKDIDKANKKQMPFVFTKLLVLCKTYRYKVEVKEQAPSLFFSNPEEEFLVEMGDLSVTWSVASERDGVCEKRWDEDDMEATRTALILGPDKLDAFIERLKTELGQ